MLQPTSTAQQTTTVILMTQFVIKYLKKSNIYQDE
jgi:hypothetical protein